MEKPLYVARKSGFSAFTLKRVLFILVSVAVLATGIALGKDSGMALIYSLPGIALLVITLSRTLWKAIRAKVFRLGVYENRMVIKEGILETGETQRFFVGITEVSVDESFFDKIINTGTVRITCPGNFNLLEHYIVEPEKFKNFLIEHFINTKDTRFHFLA